MGGSCSLLVAHNPKLPATPSSAGSLTTMATSGSYFQITPCSALMEGKEFNFCNLYLYHTWGGPRPTQKDTIPGSNGMGRTCVNNWPIYDGLGSDAKIIAHAQGLHIEAGRWHVSYSIVFENERFKGSTLEVMGVLENGDCSIVGGTGQFAMAHGVMCTKVLERKKSKGSIKEISMHGFCPSLKGTKVGPWGGNGGTPQDITETPKRLERITIYSHGCVDSISFSYFDQAGQKHMAGPWGGPGGDPSTIEFASSEFLKEVSGAFGSFQGSEDVIRSIKFVTNQKTYGPFGRQDEGTPFSILVPNNYSVVGFFGRGGKYLNAVGVYVHPTI